MYTREIPLELYRARVVLVTGGSGFIGPCVARRLADCGARVWLVGRDLGALGAVCDVYGFRAELARVNLAEPGAFRGVFQQIQPVVIFNLCGYGVDPGERDEAQANAMNARLVEEIASASAESPALDWPGMRVVHAGSSAEYGSVAGPIVENLPEQPVSLYGRTKLAGTQALAEACRKKGLHGVTARLFQVYGPGEQANRLLPSLLEAAHNGERLPMTGGEQLRDFTFVGEAAEGMVRLGCSRADAPPIVNVATGVQTSVREFAECAAKLLGMRHEQLGFGALPYRPDEMIQGAVDITLLQKLTGWKPACSIQDGLRQTLAFQTQRSRVKA